MHRKILVLFAERVFVVRLVPCFYPHESIQTAIVYWIAMQRRLFTRLKACKVHLAGAGKFKKLECGVIHEPGTVTSYFDASNIMLIKNNWNNARPNFWWVNSTYFYLEKFSHFDNDELQTTNKLKNISGFFSEDISISCLLLNEIRHIEYDESPYLK